jgi:hypothetical protein
MAIILFCVLEHFWMPKHPSPFKILLFQSRPNNSIPLKTKTHFQRKKTHFICLTVLSLPYAH